MSVKDPGEKASNPKEAFGSNKLPLHLWPATATAQGCLAFLHGALKYGKHNWREAGVRVTTYVDALYRHMAAWYEGEDLDPDSGLSHLAHALACIAVLIDADAAGKLNDDRAYPGGYGKLTRELTKLVAKLKGAAKYREALECRPEPKHYTKGYRAPAVCATCSMLWGSCVCDQGSEGGLCGRCGALFRDHVNTECPRS